jgi:predicted MFS family arabinose efflux permease
MPERPSERTIVFVVGAVQFVNILDFMMVMPLGPDFAKELGIPLSALGCIGGSYTAAAAVSGLLGSLFLDRFDRRTALFFSMLGLAIGTFSGAMARGLVTLMAARVIAGLFGGPATSVAYAVIADVVPEERRGRAMGAVMGAFAAASVLGVPAGLELSRLFGWRSPFLAVGALGLLLAFFGRAKLPSMRAHMEAVARDGQAGFDELLRGRGVLLSYALTALTMGSTFIIVPNISSYLQTNLAYPRDRLGVLYMVGGVVNFAATRGVGWLVDRYGSARTATVGCLLVSLIVYAGFVVLPPLVPVMAIFVGFMGAMAFRNVAYNTLTSKVPTPRIRARFMSIQSAVQHVAAAVGAFLSARMLHERPDKTLSGMPDTAWTSIGLMLALPFVFVALERRVRPPGEHATIES